MNHENRQQVNIDRPDELNLVELVRVLAEYKYVVIGVTVLCIIVATLAAFLTTPIYRAEILFSPAEETGSSDSISSLLPGASRIPNLNLLGSSSRRSEIAEGIATLKSPHFTIEFITENKLMPVLFAGRQRFF